MKGFSILLVTAVALVSCKKNKTPEYPDCFAQVNATHTSQISFGAGQVVYLSDTSAMVFYMDDENLNIGTACSNLSTNDLNANSYIQYVEWQLHPDSIPPELASDVVYPNTSSSRWWPVTSGNVRCSVSKEADKRENSEWYLVSFEFTLPLKIMHIINILGHKNEFLGSITTYLS